MEPEVTRRHRPLPRSGGADQPRATRIVRLLADSSIRPSSDRTPIGRQAASWEPSWEPDGLTLADTTRDEPVLRTSKDQLDRHIPTRVRIRRTGWASFGTWRPEVQILSPRRRTPWSRDCECSLDRGFCRSSTPWEPCDRLGRPRCRPERQAATEEDHGSDPQGGRRQAERTPTPAGRRRRCAQVVDHRCRPGVVTSHVRSSAR